MELGKEAGFVSVIEAALHHEISILEETFVFAYHPGVVFRRDKINFLDLFALRIVMGAHFFLTKGRDGKNNKQY
jgi:hypothetical protein